MDASVPNLSPTSQTPTPQLQLETPPQHPHNKVKRIVGIIIVVLILAASAAYGLWRRIRTGRVPLGPGKLYGMRIEPSVSDIAKRYTLYRVKGNDAPFNSIFEDETGLVYFQNGLAYTYTSSYQKDPLNHIPSVDTKYQYTTKKVAIVLDNKTTAAEYADITSCVKSECIANGRRIVVKLAWNHWLEVTEDQDSKYLKADHIILERMDDSAIAAMESLKSDQARAYPTTERINFDQIPLELRLLPGDLSQNFGLYATTVDKAKTDKNSSTCDKYYLRSAFADCLLEKFGGYRIGFDRKRQDGVGVENRSWNGIPGKLTKDEYKFIDYVILQAPLSEVEALLKTYGNQLISYDTVRMHYGYAEVDQKTIVMSGQVSESDLETIKKSISLDNGAEAIQFQIVKYNDRNWSGSNVTIPNLNYLNNALEKCSPLDMDSTIDLSAESTDYKVVLCLDSPSPINIASITASLHVMPRKDSAPNKGKISFFLPDTAKLLNGQLQTVVTFKRSQEVVKTITIAQSEPKDWKIKGCYEVFYPDGLNSKCSTLGFFYRGVTLDLIKRD